MAATTVAPRFASARVRLTAKSELARIVALVLVLDACTIVLAIVLGVSMRFGTSAWPPLGADSLTGVAWIDFGSILPLWLIALAAHDVYSPRHFARGPDEFRVLIKGSLNAALVASALAYLMNYDISRGFYLLTFVIGTGLLLLERYAVSRLVARARRADRLMHRVLAVGSVAEITRLSTLLARRPELGYEIIGACLPEQADRKDLPVPLVGTVDEVVARCVALGADTVLVAGGSQVGSADLRSIGWDLEGSDIDLIVVPSLLDVAGPRIHHRPVSGLPFLHIEPPQVARAMKWGKTVFDRVAALTLLLVFAPLFLAIALAVRLDSAGPVFFHQKRVGVGGKPFKVWKFRSMVAEAEALRAAVVASEDGPAMLFKSERDPRVTRVGRFIRRYSLDELPQLLNVLIGDMSLVGPRPNLLSELAEYEDSDRRRLLVRPGMTGLWQVSGRSNLSWDEAVRLDLYYVDNWSMAGDLVILFKTLRAVLRPEGAC